MGDEPAAVGGEREVGHHEQRPLATAGVDGRAGPVAPGTVIAPNARSSQGGRRYERPHARTGRAAYSRPMLGDLLTPGLQVVFVGTSVSETSARLGHYYANPTNKFWPLLDATGLTGNAGLTSDRDHEILDYRLGLTDLVKAVSASSDARLAAGDFDVEGFLGRLNDCRPQIVAFNGGKAAEKVARHLGHSAPSEGPIGWTVAGAAVYRLASSSGANAQRRLRRQADEVDRVRRLVPFPQESILSRVLTTRPARRTERWCTTWMTADMSFTPGLHDPFA